MAGFLDSLSETFGQIKTAVKLLVDADDLTGEISPVECRNCLASMTPSDAAHNGSLCRKCRENGVR